MSSVQVQRGHMLDLTAPSGGVVSGVPVLIGGLLAVPQTTQAETLKFAGATEGVHDLPKEATTAAFAEGEIVYWDDGAGQFDEAGSGRYAAGTAAAAAIATDTTVKVKLKGFAVTAEP